MARIKAAPLAENFVLATVLLGGDYITLTGCTVGAELHNLSEVLIEECIQILNAFGVALTLMDEGALLLTTRDLIFKDEDEDHEDIFVHAVALYTMLADDTESIAFLRYLLA